MLVGEHEDTKGRKMYGLRASNSKTKVIEEFPTPRNGEEVEKFLYQTLYLKHLIPGRADYARVMKEAVIRAKRMEEDNGNGVGEGGAGIGKKKGKTVIGFNWGEAQNDAFLQIKKSIRENVVVGNDIARRHYFAVTISKWGFGAVFFQLDREDEDKLEKAGKGFPRGKERVIQFISQRFADTETQYTEVERECLAMLRSLEEVRPMVIASRFPVVVYTDFIALVSILRNDDTRGRIAGWQARMAEYNLNPRHAKTKDLVIADGLARMPYETMTDAWTRAKEWEDVMMVDGSWEEEKRDEDLYSGGGKEDEKEQEEDQVEDNGNGVEKFGPINVMPVRYYEKGVVIIGGKKLLLSCDGSCRGNGTLQARATIGIYFGEGNENNFGGWVPNHLPQTNQVAELMAFLKAVQIGGQVAETLKMSGLVIASDSEYVCSGVTSWRRRWNEIGYKDVRNAKIFQEIERRVEYLWRTSRLTVEAWKIPRDENGKADLIANIIQDMGRDSAVQEGRKESMAIRTGEGELGETERKEKARREGLEKHLEYMRWKEWTNDE